MPPRSISFSRDLLAPFDEVLNGSKTIKVGQPPEQNQKKNSEEIAS